MEKWSYMAHDHGHVLKSETRVDFDPSRKGGRSAHFSHSQSRRAPLPVTLTRTEHQLVTIVQRVLRTTAEDLRAARRTDGPSATARSFNCRNSAGHTRAEPAAAERGTNRVHGTVADDEALSLPRDRGQLTGCRTIIERGVK
jgi:hypothetical protein